MSLILGIETATTVCSVALTREDQWLGEYRLNIKNVHAGVLAPAVERLFKDCRVALSAVNAIAVSIGPGSFTGLRIGLAFAKGLAMVHETPLVSVSTPAALAATVPVQRPNIAVLLRSRKNEFYLTTYQRDQGGDVLCLGPRIVAASELTKTIPDDYVIIAEPIAGLASMVENRSVFLSHPSAVAVATLGRQKYQQGRVEPIDALEPEYVSEFVTGPTHPSPA